MSSLINEKPVLKSGESEHEMIVGRFASSDDNESSVSLSSCQGSSSAFLTGEEIFGNFNAEEALRQLDLEALVDDEEKWDETEFRCHLCKVQFDACKLLSEVEPPVEFGGWSADMKSLSIGEIDKTLRHFGVKGDPLELDGLVVEALRKARYQYVPHYVVTQTVREFIRARRKMRKVDFARSSGPRSYRNQRKLGTVRDRIVEHRSQPPRVRVVEDAVFLGGMKVLRPDLEGLFPIFKKTKCLPLFHVLEGSKLLAEHQAFADRIYSENKKFREGVLQYASDWVDAFETDRDLGTFNYGHIQQPSAVKPWAEELESLRRTFKLEHGSFFQAFQSKLPFGASQESEEYLSYVVRAASMFATICTEDNLRWCFFLQAAPQEFRLDYQTPDPLDQAHWNTFAVAFGTFLFFCSDAFSFDGWIPEGTPYDKIFEAARTLAFESPVLRRLDSALEDHLKACGEQAGLGAGVLLRVCKRLAEVVSLLVILTSEAEPKVKISGVVLFLGTVDFPEIIERVTELSYANDHLLFQGSVFDEFTDSLLGFLGIANIWATLGDLLEGKITLPLRFLKDRFSTLARTGGGDEKVKDFWIATKALFSALKDCVTSRSLDPLFSRGNTPKDLIELADALFTHQKVVIGINPSKPSLDFQRLLRDRVLPREWTRPFSADEFSDLVKGTLSKMAALMPLVSQAESISLRDSYRRLFQMDVASAGFYNANAMRIQPLGVAFVGPPGVGKTNFADKVFRVIGTRSGFDVSDRSCYAYQRNVNFQEISPTQWAIKMDDLDYKNVLEAPGIESHIDAYMNIIDNKPAPIESAAVEEKGSNFARPLLCLVTSNNEDLKIRARVADPTAIYRRIPILVKVSGAELYMRDGKLDFSLAKGKVNIHNLDVYLYKGGPEHTFFKRMDNLEFLDFVFDYFNKHLLDQQHLLTHTDDHWCGCGRLVEVGDEVCRGCKELVTTVFQGQTPTKMSLPETVSVVGETAVEARDLLRSVRERDLVTRVEQVVDDVEGLTARVKVVVDAPSRALETMKSGVRSFGDWLTCPLGVGIAASLVAILGLVSTALAMSSFQGRVDNRAHIAPENFVRLSTDYPAGGAFKEVTFVKQQIVDAVRRNLAVVVVDGTERGLSMRVGHNLFLVPGHYFQTVRDDGSVIKRSANLELRFEGRSYVVPLSDHTLVQHEAGDLFALRVAGVPASPQTLSYFWSGVDERYSTFDEVVLVRPSGELTTTANQFARESYGGYTQRVVSSDLDTINGDCGLPVLARMGSAWRIVAIHHLRDPFPSLDLRKLRSCAVVITATEIRRLGAQINAFTQDAAVVTELFPSPFQCVELGPPTKSELANAVARGCFVVNRGHLVSHNGSSQSKSKCRRSPFYDQVEEFGASFLGEPRAFQVPDMKGGMIDGVWRSGYQHLFDNAQSVEAHDVLYPAIRDFLREADELLVAGYAPISEDEAILGVADSLIGPTNLRTSIGPPGRGPKAAWIHPSGTVHPDERARIDAVNRVLDVGMVPLVPGSCTLKDEPVKKSKNVAHDIRVFTTCSHAFNLVLKQHCAPIQIFLRQNNEILESMVGINMAGDGASRLRAKFRSINPQLDNILEGDFKKMDKTISGSLVWGVVEVFKGLAIRLGLDSLRVELLVLACFSMIYSIQGDLFQVGGMNPSGCGITVEINAVVNSLCQRAAWFAYKGEVMSKDAYALGGFPKLRFSDHCAVATYGDDLLAAHRERLDLERYFFCFGLLGMTITDGQKSEKPVYRSFTQVSFLKRSFFPSGPVVYAGLDPKSILRMLMIWKPSDLSDIDHGAIVLEEALREVFLRRDLDFEHWREFLRKLADTCGGSYWRCGYLRLESEEYYSKLWLTGKFSTWSLEKQEEPLFGVLGQ